MSLVTECWVDGPVKDYIRVKIDGPSEVVDADYDMQKVQEMKNNIENLIKRIKDP